MRRLLILGVASLLILPTMNAAAMMGGQGSRDSGRSGGDHMGGMMGGSAHGTGSYGYQYPQDNKNSLPNNANRAPGPQRTNQLNRHGVNQEMARSLVHKYMKGRTTESYRLRALKEHDTYYLAEVTRNKGSLMHRLIIDKQTGNIHSLR